MRFLIDIVVIVTLCVVGFFLYVQYWDGIKDSWEAYVSQHTIYIGSVAITVTVADEEEERKLGLSGTKSLRDLQGKLFVFENDGRHGIWMKDMFIPIDILWIDKNLQVVHIQENVTPDTYPKVFTSPDDARFVLEMNSYFVSSLKIKVGDRLTLPANLLPKDIKRDLQK
jgi:uncharacterized membrane protein (UPF0127 family)